MKRSNDPKPVQLEFEIDYRTQFNFIVNDQTFACILKDIANNDVNIVGLSTTKSRDKHNFIRLVAGTTESENKRDLKVVSEALESFDVSFKQETIIAILNIPAGIPGVFSRIFNCLWCKVEVKSIYLGEKDTIFISVSNIKKATEILSLENLEQCQNDC